MRRMKNSLAVKVFVWVACALMVCSLLVYGIVMVTIPQQYTAFANNRVEQETGKLVKELDGMDYASANKKIYNFCIRNHVAAMLTTGARSEMFGEDAGTEEAENTYSISIVLRFSDLGEDSVLTVVASASTADEITGAFLKLLPLLIVIILLISLLSAWLCSRLIAAPVLQICNVSKRMAQMDMTWHCETERTDELGILADSLNTLAGRLTQTMGELEETNAWLREEVALSRMLEKQRRDFFAAASHELKTPITVLKGQLESMMLGIGDYKNYEKYFPQTLDTVESMEQLIREILMISKMESGIPEESFTNEVIGDILQVCAAAIEPLAEEKQISIAVRLPKEKIRMCVNRRLFQKAVSNILSNAVRYSPAGQHIVITLTEKVLTVENTGTSIDGEELSSLFAPFYRSDKSRNRKSGGSGLGLYIVKTILELHDLDCKIENGENSVVFSICLNN